MTQDDADERLEQFGANQVAHDKAPHALIQLIKAFNNPFIFVLMVLAAIVSLPIIGCRARAVKKLNSPALLSF